LAQEVKRFLKGQIAKNGNYSLYFPKIVEKIQRAFQKIIENKLIEQVWMLILRN